MELSRKPITFMDLPAEIRVLIYKKILIMDNPVIITTVEKEKPTPNGPTRKCTGRFHGTGLKKNTVWPLLLCNRTVYHEAACIFYGHNIFAFWLREGEHDWQVLYTWLLAIGPQNRRDLTRINIYYTIVHRIRHQAAGKPPLIRFAGLYQWFPGTSYLTLPARTRCKWADVISPTIKKIFKILGPRSRKLTITFELPRYVHDLDSEAVSDWELYNALVDDMDDDDPEEPAQPRIINHVPKSVEKYRAMYGGDAIDVLWNALETGSKMAEQEALLKVNGWDIVDERTHGVVVCVRARNERRQHNFLCV